MDILLVYSGCHRDNQLLIFISTSLLMFVVCAMYVSREFNIHNWLTDSNKLGRCLFLTVEKFSTATIKQPLII